MDSVPEALDEIERKIMQLEIEQMLMSTHIHLNLALLVKKVL